MSKTCIIHILKDIHTPLSFTDKFKLFDIVDHVEMKQSIIG